jgi:hypothetical protein
VADKCLAFEAGLPEFLVVILAPLANLLAEPLVDELAHVGRKPSAEEPILEPIFVVNFGE